MAQAFASESFTKYTTITDIILALDKLAQRGADIFTSDGNTRSAQDILRDVVVGVGVVRTLHRMKLKDEYDIDSALKIITEGGSRIKLRSTVKEILLRAQHQDQPVLIPYTVISSILGRDAAGILYHTTEQLSERRGVPKPKSNAELFKAEQAQSMNEFVAALLERVDIKTDSGESVPVKIFIDRVHNCYKNYQADRARGIDPRHATTLQHARYDAFIKQRVAAGDQADLIFEIANRIERNNEPGEGPQTSFLNYEPAPKSSRAVEVVPDRARVMQVRPARPAATPVESINSPSLRRWLVAAGVNIVVAALCSGSLTASYLAAKKFGTPDATPAAADAPPSDWRPCTAAEFEEINGKRLRVREHQWRFAETLAHRAKAGVSKDGAMNRDPLKVVASLAVVDEDVDNFFNLHQRTRDRILCFDEQPTIVTGANGKKELELPPLARMYQGGTTDNIADDVMGYNVYWLRQDAPTPSSATIWHEMGHKYKGGATHSPTIAKLDRYDREFSLAVLAEGDFSSYINLVVNTADYVVSTYIALIQQDISEFKDLTPEAAHQLASQYQIKPKEAKAWANSIAGTFMHKYTVLEPLGVTKADLAQALIDGRMHEIANERVAEYFFEVSNELRREQRREQRQQPETGDADLRPPRDSGRSWR